ncbi:MAG TPA: Ig-like domain repeat protein [Granulicella sp.]|nr:Ig-like domain repeat protein [Granulicella sp.]
MLLTRRFSLRTPALIALAALLALPLSLSAQTSASPALAVPVASRITRPIDDNSRITLGGTVHPLARAANDRGVAPDGMQLDRLQIVLKRSDAQESALRQLIADMHTPGTASYHKWLTPDQFGQQFGPSDADIASIESWLQSHGFGSMKLDPGRQTLEFSGSVAQFRNTFHAEIHRYQVNGEAHYANATDPQIPAALSSVVGGFSSLNNFRVHRYSKTLGRAAYDPASHQATPQWTTSNTGQPYPNLALAPADFAVQYDVNPLYTAGTNGTGETIAIVNDSNINPALVTNFRTLFGLPAFASAASTTGPAFQTIIDGNDPGIDGINDPDGPNYDSIEAYLDVEWSGAVARNANIDLVIGADTALEPGLILAAEHAVYGNVAPILSLSFGECESQLGSGNAFLNELWEQAAAQGITVLVSAGDSGSAGCDNANQDYAVGGQAVSGYASTPWDVAVGGTDFYYSSYNSGSPSTITSQLGQYWSLTPSNNTPTASLLTAPVPEQPWNDSQYGDDLYSYYTTFGATTIAAGSGGASTAGFANVGVVSTSYSPYPKPSWQTTLTPTDSARDLPDVSLFAADGLNASFTPICAVDGDCQQVTSGGTVQITGVGGTSVAAPSFAGIMALVDQEYASSQGQADFVLYPLAAQFPRAFHDVVSGTNSVPCNVNTSTSGQPALDCISVSNPVTVTDLTYGQALEGQIGITTPKTAEYNAGTGYDLATGLGSIDAYQLVTNWGNVKFTPSTVTLTPSQTTFPHGTNITINGTVIPTTAAGNVALMTDDTVTPLQAGQATFTVTNGSYSGSINYLPGGTYNIYGQYSGDGTNAPSTSTKIPITVTPEASTLVFGLLNAATGSSTITAGATVQYGTQLILSGQAMSTSYYTTCSVPVPPASCKTTGYTAPTGTVTFTDSGTTLNAAPLNVAGDAEFNAPFAVGTHSVAASYSGDASYNASTAAAVAFTVAKATPAMALTSGVSVFGGTPQTGQANTFTIQVENTVNSANLTNYGLGGFVPVAAPTGSVTLTGLPSGVPSSAALAGSIDAGTTFVGSTATITAPSTTPAGTYTVTVAYSGDANYNAATSTGTLTIGAAATTQPTTTTVTSSATSTSITAGVVLTATVSAASGQAAPTGSVAFTTAEGGSTVQLGAAVALTAATANTSTATFTVDSQNLQPGSNPITVVYEGSTTFQPSSALITITDGPSFTLAGSAVTATPGTAATSTVTITPTGGFVGSVALSCAVVSGPTGASNSPTCSVSAPAAITTATPSVTATLTINTTASTTAAVDNPLHRIFTLEGGAAGVTLAALLFFGLPVRRRGWRSLLSLLVFAAIAGAVIGCGGGTTAATTTTTTGSGTTAGTYTVNVTGSGTTTSSNPAPVTQTVQVAVTVN